MELFSDFILNFKSNKGIIYHIRMDSTFLNDIYTITFSYKDNFIGIGQSNNLETSYNIAMKNMIANLIEDLNL